ncbi:MAG: glycosyltransferase family 39 protein [Asticcacaulis sp.]|nr:glycosyltransferase family 39 protein [Asticcacaulis sp.]
MPVQYEKWLRPSLVLGGLTLLVHLLFNAGYGISRDELYFIVCGQRLDWGYVDQPPIVPMLAAWSYALAGDWLIGFRLIPALTLSATVAMTAEFVRVVGGGRYAQWLAGACTAVAPLFLAMGMIFTTDTFQPLTWLACAWILVRLEQTRDERWWLALGAVVGFSLLSKYMMAFYVVALAIGLLATTLRTSLLKPWIYVGAALAAVIVLPNVLWQQSHDWPFIELGKAGVNGKNIALSPWSYFTQQLILVGPWAAPVWLSGLWWGLRKPGLAVLRALPIAYVLLFAFFVANHGKASYITAIYPALLAMGAIAIESWVANALARGGAVVAIAISGAVIAPFALPMMSEDAFIRYSAAFGMSASSTAGENQEQGTLPQVFADMHGWPDMAAKVAQVYWSLPAQDRAKAVFFGSNYGEAAAIDVYGRHLGLPPAVSGHNNYFLWGPRGHDGSVVIIIGGTPEQYASLFGSVTLAGRTDSPYAMPYETNQPIYVLRDMKPPLQTYWPETKHYQ